ncbi:hypothetical protein T484DRAFT_2743231 [Baffinella frigidus]|nr:hypothetical protein T484DRAFT_2743231 [Cryptophyta sp. CCMP2293]
MRVAALGGAGEPRQCRQHMPNLAGQQRGLVETCRRRPAGTPNVATPSTSPGAARPQDLSPSDSTTSRPRLCTQCNAAVPGGGRAETLRLRLCGESHRQGGGRAGARPEETSGARCAMPLSAWSAVREGGVRGRDLKTVRRGETSRPSGSVSVPGRRHAKSPSGAVCWGARPLRSERGMYWIPVRSRAADAAVHFEKSRAVSRRRERSSQSGCVGG